MPMVQRSSGEPGFVIDRSTHSIRLQRSLDAPPEIVFEAWTSPAHLKDWWDPSGQPLAVCKVDLRPGGAFLRIERATRYALLRRLYRNHSGQEAHFRSARCDRQGETREGRRRHAPLGGDPVQLC